MRSVFAFVALSFAACSEPDDQGLAEARKQWEDHAVVSYSFTWQESCFCDSERGRPIRIRVTSGAISEARYVDDQTLVSASKQGFLMTIDGVFDKVEATLDDGVYFTAEFDQIWGYPASLHIDPAPNATDDEHDIAVRDFAPIE